MTRTAWTFGSTSTERNPEPWPPGARISDEPTAAQQEERGHRGDEDGEGPLIEPGEQERAEHRPDRVRRDQRQKAWKEAPDPPALQDEERVRDNDRDADDHDRLPWPEDRREDRWGDPRQPHP